MEHAARSCSSGIPPLPALGGDCSLDDVAVQFLVAQTLLEREQKALVLKVEEEELEAVLASKEQRLIVEIQRFARSWDRTSRLSPVEAVAVAATWCEAKTALMKREKRKKKKKRRRRRTTRRTRWRQSGCSAALRDVSYDSLFFFLALGLYGPLYLAVTYLTPCLPEEYNTWTFLGDDFWMDSDSALYLVR